MKRSSCLFAIFACVLSTSGVAWGQGGATDSGAAEASGGFSTSTVPNGFMMQTRLQGGSLLSLSPGLLVGYQGDRLALGLAASLMRVSVSTGDGEASVGATLFELVPTVQFDVWQSSDGRSRANLLAGLGYGRASVSTTSDTSSCTVDPVSGAETCTTDTEEQSVGATLIPLALGLGGDHFLARNFALGIEAGFQGAFVVGVDNEANGQTEDVNASANYQNLYGALRATLIMGD